MNLPNDPMMLLSVINMQLRDNFSSLEDLCESEDLDRSAIEEKLKAAGFIYNPTANRFI